MPENALPGTSEWVIRHLGAEHEIEGYAGKASILAGEALPLFVSTTARGFTATAYRLGWYQGHGARQVWKSRAVRGGAQRTATVADGTNTVTTDWDPLLQVPTDDWPPGAYLVKLSADSGGQRYVPVTVRSESCAGKVVLKNGDAKRLLVRETDCFEKRDGEWKLIHQHASLPAGGEWNGKITTA